MIKLSRFVASTAILTVFFWGCASDDITKDNLTQILRSGAKNIQAEAQSDNYVIRQGDQMQISVWGYPEFNSTANVKEGGSFAVPLIGELPAAGLTKEQFSRLRGVKDAWVRALLFSHYPEQCPADWVETLHPAVDMIRVINSPRVRFLYCAPHTFYFGDDTAAMIRDAAPVLAHVHVADTFNHKASSGLRYIVNPPGSTARVHQHLDMGQGEVDWDLFFRTLAEVKFDGIATVCVFAWEERARESSVRNLEQIQRYLAKHGHT